MKEISNRLITWYLKNKRDLPWRQTTNPYAVWLSEIMLQQTRVAQGLPYYLKFIKAYPTVQDLAKAKEEEVLKLWQGLGYYSRARNMHATAQYVSNELGGVFPESYAGLKKLKGVGDYTASAIASICYKEPKAVVDGNVYRVLSRLFDIDEPINSSAGIKLFAKLAQELIDINQPDIYNQAIMEFGALHCKPKGALCASCLLQEKCLGFKNDKVDVLPVKLKKTKVKKVVYHYIVPLSQENETVLVQRNAKGIWPNLFEFPLIEGEFREDELIEKIQCNNLDFSLDKKEGLVLVNETPTVHKLSHRAIQAYFWMAPNALLKDNKVAIKDLETHPVPVLLANFMKQQFNNQ